MRYTAILREAGALGDAVCTYPVAAVQQYRYPDAEVVHFGPEQFRELVALDVNVKHFVPVDLRLRRPRLAPLDPAQWPYLDRGPVPIGQYAHVADCWHPYTAVERAMLSGPPQTWHSRIRIGLECTGLWSDDLPRELLTPIAAIPREAREWAEDTLAFHHVDGRPIVGISPFTTTEQRDWPLAHWIEMSKLLAEAGIPVLVFDHRRHRSDPIPGIRCIGLAYGRLAAVMARCSLIITADSGLLHLAAAVGTRCLGLFGPTPGKAKTEFYPLAEVLQREAGDFPRPTRCQYPCGMFSERGITGCKHACAAMEAIRPQEVADRVLSLLDHPVNPVHPVHSPAARHAGIVRPCWAIGDDLYQFPLAKAFKRRYGEVTVWSTRTSQELWAMCPDLDHWVAVDQGRGRARGDFDTRRWPCFGKGPVPLEQFARVFEPWPEAMRVEKDMILRRPEAEWWSRVGSFLRAAGLYDELPRDEAIRRYKPELRLPEADRAWAEAWLRERDLWSFKVIAVAPFANAAIRSLRRERAAELLNALHERGFQTLLLDKDLPRSANLPGAAALGLPIGHLAALVSRCALMISVDSGPYHLAAALDVPAIGLFGLTPGRAISEFYPLARVIQRRAGEFPAPRGCLYPCNDFQERGRGACKTSCPALQAITAAEVVEAATEMLSVPPSAPSPPKPVAPAREPGGRVELTAASDGQAAIRMWRDLGSNYLERSEGYARCAAALDKALGGLAGVRVLDVGCAAGHITVELIERGAIAYGIDVLAWPVEHSPWPQLRGRLRQADVRDMPEVHSEVFDVAYANNVLEHLPPADVPRALAEIARVLRPGGLLIAWFPPFPKGSADLAAERDPTHLAIVPRAQWLAWLAAAGLLADSERAMAVSAALDPAQPPAGLLVAQKAQPAVWAEPLTSARERRLVLTMAIGREHEQIAEFTHPRMAHYAHRIGAEFQAIRELRVAKSPVWEKFRLWDLLAAYDRVLWLDNDIAVRLDAPDLFDLVPADSLGMLNEGLLADRTPQMNAAAPFYGQPVPPAWNGRDYYNAGVIVASPAHRDLFRKPDREMVNHMAEQSYLNLTIQTLGIRMFPLPLAANAMSICQLPPEEAYIVHAAGCRGPRILTRLREAVAAWHE